MAPIATQEACSQSVSCVDDTNSCPQVGEETQAQLEEFLGEASCPRDVDDNDTDGATLAAQEKAALRVKRLIETAAQQNNRALAWVAQRKERPSPPAETDRPEKQQRTDTLQQPPPHVAEHSSDDVSQDLMCPKPRRAAEEAGSDAAGGLPAAASPTPKPQVNDYDEEDGQSLLLAVPQSPVGDDSTRQDATPQLEKSTSNTQEAKRDSNERRRSSAAAHDSMERPTGQGDDDDDEHVESSLPMESQFTQASQQTPGPETPFDRPLSNRRWLVRRRASTPPGICRAGGRPRAPRRAARGRRSAPSRAYSCWLAAGIRWRRRERSPHGLDQADTRSFLISGMCPSGRGTEST